MQGGGIVDKKRKIKDFFLYGGKTKNEYKDAEALILKSNYNIWKVISFISSIVFLSLTIFAIVAKRENAGIDKIIACGIMSSLSLAVLVLLSFVFKPKSIGTRILIYLLAIMIIGYGIYVGNSNPSIPAITFMVVLVVTPIAIVDKPYRIITMIISVVISEIVMACIFKREGTINDDLLNTIVFGVVAIIVDTYLLKVRISGYINERILRRMAYRDSLTGLGNELSYLEKREELDKKIKALEDVEFGLVMLDVNNVKLTNDTYGHIYGCSMIVEAAHYLKTIFESSKLYHIGGDEFLIVVVDNDLKRIDEILKEFDKAMENYYYKKNSFELRLTVARGFTRYDKEIDHTFSDVLARADAYMYTNKKEMKDKYNLPSR